MSVLLVNEQLARQLLLGALFAHVRVVAGMTQAELASKLGVSQATLSRIEHGEAPISESVAYAWLKTCGQPIDRSLEPVLDGAWERARVIAERTFPQQGLFAAPADWWERPLRLLGADPVRGLFVFTVACELHERPLTAVTTAGGN